MKNLEILEQNEQNVVSRSRYAKLTDAIANYKNLNSHLILVLQKICHSKYLAYYAELILALCHYLSGTVQNFYVALDKSGHPIWIYTHPEQKPLHS